MNTFLKRVILVSNEVNTMMTQRKMEKERASNIEILRIVAALGVIALHINLKVLTEIEITNANKLLLYIAEAFCISSVNIFLLITGFFMCKSHERSLLKPLEMVVELICIKIAFYCLALFTGHQSFNMYGVIKTLIPNNYYVILYIALYLVSVYYNKVITSVSAAQMKIMLIILFVLFSVYPTIIDTAEMISGQSLINLSTITRDGSTYGYNIVHFSLMYNIGAYFGHFHYKRVKRKYLISILLIVVSVIAATSYFAHRRNGFSLGVEYSYCNPLVVISAVVIFLLFVQTDLKTSRIINRLARASFTAYLLHPWIIKLVPFEKIMNLSPAEMVASMVVLLICIYLICWIVHEVWNIISKPIIRKLERVNYKIFV